jgi:hypothetical protein
LRRFFHDGPVADLYVSLGDLTQNGEEAEYRGVFSVIETLGRRSSFVHIPGNHDLLTADAAQTERWGSTPPIADGHGAIDTDSALLLFLNTCQVKKKEDWGGRLERRQLEWFGQQLARADGKPVLVFAHHPLPDTTALSERTMMRVEQAEPLLQLMEQVRVPCFWFNGHNHIQTIVRRDRWTFVQTASAVCMPCWRDVVITDEAVRVETTRLTEEAIVKAAEQTLRCYPGFHRVKANDAVGGKDDQAVEIRLRA